MALKVLQPRAMPYGQFDGLDADVTSVKGGEVVSFTYVSITGSDKGAADLNDGYSSSASKTRAAVTKTLVSGTRPLFLVDDGVAGYGTLFGEVVGSQVGKIVTGGTQLGPHTASGSGKLTLWGSVPGTFGVSLDGAADTNATTGLMPSNPTLVGGAALYATAAGLLTPNAGSAFEAIRVGTFIEFNVGIGSMVTSSPNMVQAINSPANSVAPLFPFTTAVFYWCPLS